MIFIKKFESYQKSFQKDELIEFINFLLRASNEIIMSSSNLELDADIFYKEDKYTISLIDTFYIDGCSVSVYGGYKKESVIDSYNLKYSNLTKEILQEIFDILLEKLDELYTIDINNIIKDNYQIFKKINDIKYKNHEYPSTYDTFLINKTANNFNI